MSTSSSNTTLYLNTSSIVVPSTATMVQHLVDYDPHPQYVLGTELKDIVNSSINVSDLADTKFGIGVADDSLMIYHSGAWRTITVASMVSSMGGLTSAAVVEEIVQISQSNTSTLASAIVPGRIISVYDDSNIQIYPTINYVHSSSIITADFGSTITERWTIVHTVPTK